MPISTQEGGEDFISIKQVWLMQINRCNEALSNFVLKDRGDFEGGRAAISAVNILILNLVDYGDATVKTEYNEWWKDQRKKFAGRTYLEVAEIRLEKVIEILNKYQLLHDSLPRGYSNVVMESVQEVKDE